MTERTRAYVYRIYVASVPLVTLVLGVLGLDAVEAGLWTAAVGGFLAGLLAVANTTTAVHPHRRMSDRAGDDDNRLDV